MIILFAQIKAHDHVPLLLLKIQRSGINAIAQARRRGAIVEDVAEMRAAIGAGHFRAWHPTGAIGMLLDLGICFRRVKAGPSAACVEFRIAFEERRATRAAFIDATLPKGFVLAGERAFRPFLAHDAKLLGS